MFSIILFKSSSHVDIDILFFQYLISLGKRNYRHSKLYVHLGECEQLYIHTYIYIYIYIYIHTHTHTHTKF